jgi:hypothetical protein
VPSERLSDEAQVIFEHAAQREFYGPEVLVEPVTDEADPDLIGRFLALDRVGADLWVIGGDLVSTNYGPTLRGLTVRPWPLDAPREITSGLLRGIRVGDLRDRAYVQLRFATGSPTGRATTEDEAERIEAADAKPRRGRKPLPDSHYRRIAQAYVDLQEQHGRSHGLIRALAEAEHVSEAAMRGWIHRARQRGYLPQARKGRSSAGPGPRLYESQPNTEEESS